MPKGSRGGSKAGSGGGSISAIVNSFEKENYLKSTENGLLIIPNGTTKEYSGNETDIIANKSELSSMNGAIFTHNHPINTTFSNTDIRNGIVVGNLKELRAITSSGDIHILKNNNATVEQRRKFAIDFEQARMKATNIAHSKIKKGEKINVSEYINQRLESFMSDNAQKYNLLYQKARITR